MLSFQLLHFVSAVLINKFTYLKNAHLLTYDKYEWKNIKRLFRMFKATCSVLKNRWNPEYHAIFFIKCKNFNAKMKMKNKSLCRCQMLSNICHRFCASAFLHFIYIYQSRRNVVMTSALLCFCLSVHMLSFFNLVY